MSDAAVMTIEGRRRRRMKVGAIFIGSWGWRIGVRNSDETGSSCLCE
jgi:hypothetical protein